MKKINIGKDFSEDPSGRFYTDGDGSGEEFREEVLRPIFKSTACKIGVEIDDVDGYGSSFLVEAFAGLIKYGYLSKEELKNRLYIISSDPDYDLYKERIYEYIQQAEPNSKEYVSSKDEAIEKGWYANLIDCSEIVNKIKDCDE